MIDRIFDGFFNIVAQIGFVLIMTSLVYFNGLVIHNNIKYFEVYKKGEIIDIEYTTGSQTDGLKGSYDNTLVTDIEKDTVIGGTQELYEIGDKVRFRYAGTQHCVIFEVNGESIGSKYDIWDWLSPFLFCLSSFLLVVAIYNLFSPPLLKLIQWTKSL